MAEFVTQTQRFNAAAGTDVNMCFAPANGIAGEVWKLRKISLIPNVAVAADGTDYIILCAYKGASTALMSVRNTSSTAFTQYTPEALVLTAVGSDLEISNAATGILSLRATHAGSGKAYDFSVVAEFERLRS